MLTFSNTPLQFCKPEIIAHYGWLWLSHWLTLAYSGSLWLFSDAYWLTRPLHKSPRRGRVATIYPFLHTQRPCFPLTLSLSLCLSLYLCLSLSLDSRVGQREEFDWRKNPRFPGGSPGGGVEQAGADQQRHQGQVALVNFDHVTLLKILTILTLLTMIIFDIWHCWQAIPGEYQHRPESQIWGSPSLTRPPPLLVPRLSQRQAGEHKRGVCASGPLAWLWWYWCVRR